MLVGGQQIYKIKQPQPITWPGAGQALLEILEPPRRLVKLMILLAPSFGQLRISSCAASYVTHIFARLGVEIQFYF